MKFMAWLGYYLPFLYEWGMVPCGDVGDGYLWFDHGAGGRNMNGLDPDMPEGTYEDRIRRQSDLGANWTCLFSSNGGDGQYSQGSPMSIYKGNVVGGEVDDGMVKMMKKRIRYARRKGLTVTLCLHSDDDKAGLNNKGAPQDTHHRDVVNRFDKYVCSYWLILEPQDSGWNRQYIADRVTVLKGMTNKPIGLHDYPRSVDRIAGLGADHAYVQYWHPQEVARHSAAEMTAQTASFRSRIGGMKLHATEWGTYVKEWHAHIKALAKAAKGAGAFGSGSGVP